MLITYCVHKSQDYEMQSYTVNDNLYPLLHHMRFFFFKLYYYPPNGIIHKIERKGTLLELRFKKWEQPIRCLEVHFVFGVLSKIL